MLRRTSLLSRVRMRSSTDVQPTGAEDGSRQPGDVGVAGTDGPGPVIAGERRQLGGEAPRLGAGHLDAEPHELFVVPAAEAVEQADPGRDRREVFLDTSEQRSQDLVHPIEVPAQVGQQRPRRGLGGGDAEVEVDVGIDLHEEVLEDDRPRLAGGLESDLPRLGRRAPGLEEPQRGQVAVGEGDVEALDPLAVVEEAAGDAFGHLGGDLAVDRREVTKLGCVLRAPGR